MAWIYCITNDINGKQYIGKTYYDDIQERWDEHLQDYKRPRCEKRPLYDAMNKYGIQHFHITPIEYVPSEINLEEREIYWIAQYNTYHNGYNATMGGDGKRKFDYDLVIKTYQEVQNIKETAKIIGAHPDSISNILKAAHIEIKSSYQIQKEKYGKPIKMYSLNGDFLQSFESTWAAARYMVENKLTNCKVTTIKQHIHEVCEGRRKTAAKFKWSYY